MTTLDDRLRTRLAEIRAAAGVPHAQLSLDVLYYLPKGFLDAYAELFTRAVKADGGESARNDAQQQQAGVGKAAGPGAKPAKKRYKKTFVVQDEKMLLVKTMVDKRLRNLAREMQTLLAGGDVEVATEMCVSCHTIVKSSWRYCPHCGKHQARES